jgi:hypothetical protein
VNEAHEAHRLCMAAEMTREAHLQCTTALYKTRSLGYLAEPLDISAEQGYLNPRVGYLDR